MKAKRFLSLLLTMLMILSSMGSFVFGTVANAETVSAESLTDNMIFVSPNWTPANLPDNITVDGRTYDLFWGKNAYSNPQTAVDAAPEFGTVYLCAGGYITTITVKKSLTILGAKHGIDPNIRGANDKELWTLNPERGMDETLLQASLNLGSAGGKQYSNQLKVVVDGIMIGGKGQITAIDGTAGYGDFELKNIYLKNSLHTGPAIYMTSYYNGAANAFKRFISIENMRVEGQTKSNVMTVTADGLDISGVYLHTDCTMGLLSSASASNGPTDEVYWNIHDSFFAAPVARVFYLNWYIHSSNNQDMTLGVANRSKIINNIYNNIFVDATAGFRFDKQQNVYFNYVGNAFYNENSTTNANGLIYGWIDYNNRAEYADQIVVKSNKFIGDFPIAYILKWNTTNVDVSGNYTCINGAVGATPLVENSKATEDWYWLDEAMTVKSTDENPGTGYAVNATQGLDGGKSVTVSDSLPDTAVLVNPDWSETTLPATYTVRGKTFTLNWGVNAFADAQSAVDTARNFGTVYLCAGSYEGFTIKKNLTLLGAKYGIDPNVRGEKKKDLWTLNPARGNGEAVITGVVNLGVDAEGVYADIIKVDGVQLTGVGQLSSNSGDAGSCDITLKNIYIKDSTVNGILFSPILPEGHTNAFQRFVTIDGMRVEGQSTADVMLLTADSADISGVYMHTDCSTAFFSNASASTASTAEVVWSIYDNMFAPSVRCVYLCWHKHNVNGVALATGAANRSKVINKVHNNTVLQGDIGFWTEAETVYYDFQRNNFYDCAEYAFYGYCTYDKRKDFSDQIIVKNNNFIEVSIAYYLKNNKQNVDVSGNYSCNDGQVGSIALHSNSKAAEDWYWLDPLMTRKSTDTTVLKAPTNVLYEMDQLGTGRADGVVTVTLPAGHGAEDIYLFWGDENGRLEGYSALAPFKVGGNVVACRLRNGSIIPEGATRLLAYSYSDACGMSESFAGVDLPYKAAMNETALGEPIMEFQAVGDIHVSTTTNGRIHHAQHLEAMLEDVKAISPDSIGIFSNGDVADRGIDADYERMLEVLSSVEDAPTIYHTFGNHETFRYDLPIPNGSTLSQFQDPFYDHLGNFIPADAVFSAGERYSSLSYTFTKNGIKFISLGTDVLHQNWLELSDATIAWLKTQLDADRDATKPVFIIMHQPMQDTASDSYNVRPATAAKLKAVLKDYPEVIMFNGHTHDSLYEAFTFYQGDEIQPNIFNCSSVGYIPVTYHGNDTSVVGAEGYYVYVYEDQVIVKGRDFLTGEWIASAQYVIDMDDAAGDVSEDVVKSPVSGRNTPELVRMGNTVSGNVTCFMPTEHNATHLALFFADADTGIIGSNPFATTKVSDPFASGDVAVGFADVAIPEGADYILAYAYSTTLGFSADCDVIPLADLEDMTETYANGNVCTTGNIKTDKKVYKLGEPIYVTATMHTDGDWVGMQLASVTSGSFLNYHLNVAGSDVPVDITDETCISFNKFQQVTAGYWEIGWIPNGGKTFQTAKTDENLITIHIVDQQNEALGLPDITTATTVVNYDLLTAAIEKAESFAAADYTTDSFAVLSAALDTGRAATAASQATVDAAVIALENDMAGMAERSAESIAVTTAPTKTTYHQDKDALDVTGGKVTVYYNNNTTKVIDLATEMVSGFDNTKAGTLTLTVTAEGKTATFNVTVEAHTPGEVITDTPATCMAKGVGHKDCTVCGQVAESNIKIPVDATNHTGNNHTENKKDATCTELGYTGDTVCECGVTITKGEEIPMASHTAGEWKTVKEATTTATGLKEQRCTACNALLDSEVIAKKKPVVCFTDLKKSDYFYSAVAWAVEAGVTTGTTKTTFGPEESCTRAQAVTFLWRAAGSPAPKTSNNPFKDVKKSDYYYKAVLWAVENGITKGTSATEFSPEEACTRGQIVTFLWRAQSGKKVSASNPFSDVRSNDFYYNAVLWAVKNNVTTGTSKNAFSPEETCTRGQIVTFLYRALAK